MAVSVSVTGVEKVTITLKEMLVPRLERIIHEPDSILDIYRRTGMSETRD